MKKHTAVLVFAVLLNLAGYYVVQGRIEPFQYFFYITSWWSYIIFIDTLLTIRTKNHLILNRNVPFLVVISSGFWCVFELINLRIENWFYINLPTNTLQRWAGYLLAYGTVIPAIYVTKELVYVLLGKVTVKPVHLRRYPPIAVSMGLTTLLLTLAFPRYCFPLAWIFLALMLDGYNYSKGFDSFVRDWENGTAGPFLSTLLSGLICGILWETWNFWTVSKWVYSVPFFESLKMFEMPVPGYLGFPVFAIETIAFVNFLRGIKIYKKYLLRATIVALLLSFFTFSMIDGHTVFSYATDISRLSFIEQGRREALQAKGARTSYGIDVRLLDHKEKEALSLIHLKGLGYDNYVRLRTCGIMNVGDLSRQEEKTLSAFLQEPNLRRIRVYLRAAKAYQGQREQ